MSHTFKKLLSLFGVALALAGVSAPMGTKAQTYPIDCAILLCLSGGWPTSAPCSLARAEFIRRITPYPVEPPLQIWRCPMGASYETHHRPGGAERIFEALSQKEGYRPLQSFPADDLFLAAKPENAVWPSPDISRDQLLSDHTLRFVQDRADIDISGPEFNFVRSIRVFDVRYASQATFGEQEQCRRYASVYLGTYGIQGDFSWTASSPTALPDAHVGLEGWGSNCPSLNNRSVFVDWHDYDGNYGFEQVNY